MHMCAHTHTKMNASASPPAHTPGSGPCSLQAHKAALIFHYINSWIAEGSEQGNRGCLGRKRRSQEAQQPIGAGDHYRGPAAWHQHKTSTVMPVLV